MDKQAIPEVRNTVPQLLNGLSRFWQWWSGELLGMLPEDAVDRFKSRRQYMVIEINPEQCAIRVGSRGNLTQLATFPFTEQGLELNAIANLSAQATAADEVILLLPPDMLLSKQLSLPLATAANLDNVLGFEMDRYTPFNADQVYFGYRIDSRDTSTQMLHISLLLIRRTELDPLLLQLKSAGLSVTVVAPAAESSKDLFSMNLLPKTPASGVTAGRGVYRAARIGIGLVLFAALLWLPFKQQEAHLESMQAGIEELRQEAETAQQFGEQIEQLSERQAFLQSKKELTVSRLALLNELTGILPDHTWINNFKLDGNTLRLEGESETASSLISVLEESKLLRNVSFSSPVTLNARSNKERFTLLAQLGKESP
jgi:general secretion pathway protein L